MSRKRVKHRGVHRVYDSVYMKFRNRYNSLVVLKVRLGFIVGGGL